MSFKDLIFLSFLPITFLVAFYIKMTKTPGLRFSSIELLKDLKSSFKLRLARNVIFMRTAAACLIILALARPQLPIESSKMKSEGIDIVLAIDCSTTMLAEDFVLNGARRNRLDVVKSVVRDFIDRRSNDRIGIVAFAGRAYMACPLTTDYSWLLQNLERVKIGIIEDGTAIGSGVMASMARMKDAEAKTKVVILLTDGINNTGVISPLTAAEAAKALKIKIYTIGVGSKGPVPYPVQDFFGNIVYKPTEINIDEDILTQIAAETGARYFMASNTESLKEIYNEIDKLEKTQIEQKGYTEYNELFYIFLIPALAMLILEIALSNTFLRKIP